MFIEKITICNLFAYYGEVSVDFKRTESKPLYAIFGNNGFGKTSFINAIKLLFLGTGLLEDTNIPPTIERIAPQFKHSHAQFIKGSNTWSGIVNKVAFNEDKKDYFVALNGKINNEHFSLKRVWNIEQHPLQESLILELNGERFENQNAQEKINNILPPEFVEFFFFNGEEVGLLSENLRTGLREKIENILQIKPLKIMLKQIDAYGKELKNNEEKNKEKRDELELKHHQKEGEDMKINQFDQKIKDYKNEILELETQINEISRKKDKLQSDSSKEKEEIITHKNDLETKKRHFKINLIESLKNVIFITNNELLEDLQTEIKKLESSANNSDLEAFKRLLPELKECANNELEAAFKKPENLSKLKHLFSKILDRLPQKLALKNIADSIMPFNIISTLKESLARLENSTFANDINELKYIKNELLDAQNQLDELQSSDYERDILAQLDKESQEAKDKKNTLEKQRDEHLLEFQKAKSAKEALEREINILEQGINTERIDKELEILKILKDCIESYKDKLIGTLREELREKIRVHYKELIPNDNVSAVEISEDFEIRLKNENDEMIIIQSQSSGQKQILAMAIFWALSDLSNSRIPLIIDTPLARIDNPNRKHIIQHYYAKSAKQVIILPTK